MTTKTPDTATVTGRIAWLMQKLWRGSQTEMAAYLGVAQGTIANVLSGRRTAGRVLLSKLAAHPLVNDKWLHEGSGSPLLQEASGVGSEIDWQAV